MTIIIGVQCTDGNIIASDGRVMAGDFILRDDEPKVVVLGDKLPQSLSNIIIAGSGDGAAVQHIERQVASITGPRSPVEAAYEVSAIINKAVLEYSVMFQYGSYFFSTGPKDLYYQKVSKEQTLPFRVDRYFASGVGYPIAQYLLHMFLDDVEELLCEAVGEKILTIGKRCYEQCAEIGGKMTYGCYMDNAVIVREMKEETNQCTITANNLDGIKKYKGELSVPDAFPRCPVCHGTIYAGEEVSGPIHNHCLRSKKGGKKR